MHLVFFLIICFLWIPILIASILLAYKLDHKDNNAMKLRYVFIPFWTLDAIICLIYFTLTAVAIHKELKNQNDNNRRRSIVCTTFCSLLIFSILFVPLLVLTIQLCKKDEQPHWSATYGNIFTPLIVWMSIVLIVVAVISVVTAKENERLHEFRERIRIEDDLENGERGIRDGNGRIL